MAQAAPQPAIRDPFAKSGIQSPTVNPGTKMPHLPSTTLEGAGAANGVNSPNLNDTGGPKQINSVSGAKAGAAPTPPTPAPQPTPAPGAPAAPNQGSWPAGVAPPGL